VKVKMNASILLMTTLSAVMFIAAEDNEEKRDKTRKMGATESRACPSHIGALIVTFVPFGHLLIFRVDREWVS
jgi:hypothetical protein